MNGKLRITAYASTAIVWAGAACAAGIEQTTQSPAILFEPGSYVEFNQTFVKPDVAGTDAFAEPTGSVGPKYSFPGIALKYEFNKDWSAALIYDEPYQLLSRYPINSTLLGQTGVNLGSKAVTALGRYKADERLSFFGGLRAVRIGGEVELRGLAFGPLDGYMLNTENDVGVGAIAGLAYEVPEIGARVALTYSSKIKIDAQASEIIPATATASGDQETVPSRLTYDLPQSVNLDFQVGLSQSTLAFGSVRWVDWRSQTISPLAFSSLTGEPISAYDKSVTTYTLGLGHQFTENLSGAIFASVESPANREASPLGPVDGYRLLGVAVTYQHENRRTTIGVARTWLRDTAPTVGTDQVANFSDGAATAIEVKIGYSF